MLLQPVLDHTPLYRMLKGEVNNPNMVLAHITRSLTLFGVLRFAFKFVLKSGAYLKFEANMTENLFVLGTDQCRAGHGVIYSCTNSGYVLLTKMSWMSISLFVTLN
jgi:hypothetical protein